MKREDLKVMGLTDEQIEKIMAENGKDVEKHKTAAETAKTEADGLKNQLTEAGKQIEAFKGMDIEGVKKSADEWKNKAETATAEAAKQVAQLKFDHALDSALTGAKAKNAKAVKALLDTEQLKYNEADGSIIGLKDQLEKIQKENDYLFEGEGGDPKIVTHTNNQSTTGTSFMAALRKGASLPDQGK